ncbi:MAG: hypothetical protein KAR23_04340, partial [Candidatus Aenigmarchaeota archaeon]|nr:hypothetical protein [Candidatus Aenigmarchaeota archaeon]
ELYNKGDVVNIDVLVYNANNETVSNFNTTIRLAKPTVNVTLVDDKMQDNASYSITISDLPTNTEIKFYTYAFAANVSKDGNSGNDSKDFNVTKHLVANFVSVDDGQYVAANSIVPLTVEVTNIRGDETHEALVSVECSKCVYNTLILTKVSSTLYANMEKLIAPSSSTSFGVIADPVDLYKNGEGVDDDNTIVLTTISQNTPEDDSGGGGDTPTGFIGGLMDKILDDDKEEKVVKDFIFDTEQDELKIIQGESAEIIAYLENTGDTDLNITVSYSLDCCTVEINDSYFIKAKNKQSLTINVFSDLLEKPGTYKFKITMDSENITKDKTLTVKIEKNQMIMMLESLENNFRRMKILVDDFDRLDMDISPYLEYINTSEMLIAKAYAAIASNDVQSLESAVSDLSVVLDGFDAKLAENELLKWLLENKYDLIKSAIVIIIALLMLYSYLLPLFMLSLEYNQLKNKEVRLAEEERSTEKEYFKRIIDKTTFNKIITEKHEQLTDVRTRMTHIKAALKMLT